LNDFFHFVSVSILTICAEDEKEISDNTKNPERAIARFISKGLV
jgi:hypothetical protein